jgi:hypothetical protein
MFIGHYSAALIAATHRDAPRLGTLFVAAQIVDVGFFTFVLSGIEAMRITPGTTVMNPMDLYHMPYTHSLTGTFVWAAGFALILKLFGAHWRTGLIGGLVVISHWFLDLIVHAPDLTLAGAPPKLGFGLWNYPMIEMPLEIGLTGVALWLYLKSHPPVRKSFAVPALVFYLGAVQAFNWFAPQPTTLDLSVPISALLAYGLATGLAVWVAHGRRPVGGKNE